MAYEKLNLVKGDIFKAEHVAHMEEGIAQNDEKLVELSEDKLDKGSPTAHQQMTTDAYSVATWEDKTHYDSEMVKYEESVYNSNDETSRELILAGVGYIENRKVKYHENSYFIFAYGEKQVRVEAESLVSGGIYNDSVITSKRGSDGLNQITMLVGTDGINDGDVLFIAYCYPVLKQLDEKFLPSTVPVIKTATVGQTIAVKAVDENGKPTEWEAVDAASGGGVVVFYLDSNDWEGYLYKDEALSTKVTYNELFAAVISSMIVLHWANEYQTAYVYPTTLSSVSPKEAATYAEVEYSLFGEDCVVHTSEWTESSGPQ